jgi:hypothetical protein|tara:strand:+ start:97 stop:204 length:108 start_codon:yes stop_codon:yes gene_type:complete
MNKRLIGVGIALGIVIAIAVIVGSPAGPFGFDAHR